MKMYLNKAFQGLKIAFSAVRNWTDPATEGTPYMPYEPVSVRKLKLVEKKAWLSRKWAIN